MTPVKLNRLPLNSLLDNFFNVGFDDHHAVQRSFNRPAVNIHETNDAFVVEVAAPGMEKSDFNIKVEKNQLTLTAKQETEKSEEGKNYKRREFSFTSFERSFVLPDSVNAENINASYTNGILSVELPKKPEAKPVVKTIEIA